jgi:protein NrfC
LLLGLKITGVFVGGSILSLVPSQEARSELLGTSVVGTYPYQPHYGFRNTVLSRKKTGIAASKMIREFLPVLCNQCNRPPCVRVCPTKATYKDKKNGIVMMNASLCIGCKACMTACPYNARYYNREIQAVDKCDFCYRRRLQNGETNTACAEVCPADALFFGDMADQKGDFYKLLHKPKQTILVLRPESGAMPNIFYLQGK